MAVTKRLRAVTLSLVVASWVLLLTAPVYAQSAIAGVVTDETRAVLPGVTVEAASPALIEQVRTGVTDAQGRYTIADLRPGTYSVTFTLLGFTTVVREGIELRANFTAPVNVVLRVGGIEESLTVSGESPVVDVQRATRQQVMTRELLDSVPSGRSIWAYGQTAPSVTTSAADVGGTRGTQESYMAVHGSYTSDNTQQIDGMSTRSLEADGNWTGYHNTMMFEEISYATTGSNAEVSSAGIRINQIPKEGGNAFAGQTYLSYVPGAWGSDNVTGELKARGLAAGAKIDRIFDYNPSLGGPILRDRLWFFSTFRYWGSDTAINNSFFNLTPRSAAAGGRPTYKPDLSRQTVDDNLLKSGVLRLTQQVAQRHKFAAYMDRTFKFRGHEGGSLDAAEGTTVRYPRIYYSAQAKYTGTLSSRLLVEGGLAISNWTWDSGVRRLLGKGKAGGADELPQTDIGRVDRALSTSWSAPNSVATFWSGPRHVLSGSLSYVTGTHAFKTGISWDFGTAERWITMGQPGVVDLFQEYRNGVPESVVVYNTPIYFANRLNHDLAFYVQDAWTIDRLTVSPGLRVEWLNTEVPVQVSGAGRFVPAREFAREECMPCWGPDVSPRLSVAYDLFGTARTALKASVGKYMRSNSVGFAQTYNPMRTATDRRTWTDLNGDDIAQDNEIGRVNRPFDLVGVRTRNPDPDIQRAYQWEGSAGVQQEIAPGVSVSANYVRRTWRRLTWRENLLVGHGDYTPVSIQNPIDASDTIVAYNLDRAKLGLVDELDRNSDENKRWNNGFDVDITARVGGGNVFAGVSWDKQIRVECEVADPNDLRFCDQSAFGMPYRTMFKMAGMYPLPYGVEVSGSVQSYAGGSQSQNDSANWQQVNYQVRRSIIPTLTQSSVTVPLIQPGTKYLPRWNQVDLRLAKRFDVGDVRLRGQFDIYNVTNSNSILGMTQTYGSALDRVTSILPARVFGFSLRVDY